MFGSKQDSEQKSANTGQPSLTSSSAMAERPRELGDFKKARVNGMTDNDSLKDSHKCLRCCWQTHIIWWSNHLFYSAYSCYIQISTVEVINIAANHQMFMTLAGKLSWQHLRRLAVDFYSKNEKSAFWATLSGLRGNVRTPSIARWKARGRLYIRNNWTFFIISYGWDVISGNLSKSAFFEVGLGHSERIF